MSLAGETQPTSLQLELAANPGSVGVARHAVAEFAGENGADADAVAVAVSETVTNAVVHAFADRPPGCVEVRAKLNGEGLLVIVSDDGNGINPNPNSPGLGFGLALVASVAEEMGITRSPQGGTSVRMRFAAAA